MSKEQCPRCKGQGYIGTAVNNPLRKKGYLTHVCYSCNGSGNKLGIDYLRGLLFESMIQDSLFLRQKALWNFELKELEEAIWEQINIFMVSIEKEKEKNPSNGELFENPQIIEYQTLLSKFEEWSEYFLKEASLLNQTKEYFK